MKPLTTKPITTLIAFDFGMKRIGLAIGQTITQTARPLEMLPAKDGIPEWMKLAKIIRQWQPDALVIGIPLNMDGSDQPITKKALDFANSLRNHFSLPVFEVDERLTTKDARERLFQMGGYKALQNGRVDSMAAQLILENWFLEN